MQQKWFHIYARAGNTSEIAILDEIGAFGITAKAFADSLAAIANASKITVSINSPGGSIFDALAIFNMLKSHKASVTVRIDGVAASAASVIAMAGAEIIMPENAFLMIHNPVGYIEGEAGDLRDLADGLDKIRDSLVGIYAARSGQPHDKIVEMMAKETWLTAQEAKNLGFADTVTAEVKAAASFNLKARFSDAPELPVITGGGPQEIVALCKLAGKPELADGFIAQGKSLDDVREEIQALRNASSDEEIINRNNGNAQPGSWDKVISKVNASMGLGKKPEQPSSWDSAIAGVNAKFGASD